MCRQQQRRERGREKQRKREEWWEAPGSESAKQERGDDERQQHASRDGSSRQPTEQSGEGQGDCDDANADTERDATGCVVAVKGRFALFIAFRVRGAAGLPWGRRTLVGA